MKVKGYVVPKRIPNSPDRIVELLEKLLVFQMYALGAPQDRIAKAAGRQKAWVNGLVKGLRKGGPSNASETQGESRKAQRRRRG
jgi:hypothetical protein